MKLYRPIGTEWATQGWWKIHEPYGWAEDTMKQYLGLDDREWIPIENEASLPNLNYDNWKEGEVYRIRDTENNFVHRAITLDQFKKMRFDYIIPTFPTHDWKGLLNYQPQAKYIVQLGNEGQTTNAENILCSTMDFNPLAGQRMIRYHQEFDLSDYKYVPPTNHNTIRSFVVSLPEPETYESYKNALPEFDFHAYGVGSPDGTIPGNTIPQRMKDSAWGFHIKSADGFGHIIHKWFASGRPIITKASYYRGKFAEPLLIDGATCIDLDKRSFEENVALIKSITPERHLQMCENAIKRFNEVVNFDVEANLIREFITNLK